MSRTVAAAGSFGGVARGGAVNLAASVASAVLTFGLTVVVTRGLPPDLAGVFFTATSAFLVVVAIAQLGTNTGLVYFIARTRTLGRTAWIPAYLRAATIPVLAWTTVLVVVLFVFAPHIAQLINPDHADTSASSIRILAPFLWFAAIENVAASAPRGVGAMRPAAVTTLVLRPLGQVIFVLVATEAFGYEATVVAWGLGYLLSTPLAVAWSRRILRTGILGAPVAPVGSEFWRYTSPRAVMTVAQIAMQRLDIVLVAALAGAVPAATYAAATRFVVAGQMGTQAVSIAAQPRFAEDLASGDVGAASHLFRMSTAWLVLMTWPLYIALAIYAGLAMSLFGVEYSDGATTIVILSLALMFSTALGMVEVLLMMSGRSLWTLINSLVGLGLQIALDIWLIPVYGVLGAAIGWAGAIVVRNVVALVQVMIALRMHPFGGATVISCALAAAAVGVPLAGARLLWGESWISLTIGGAAAVVAYAGGAYLLRDRLHIGEFVRSLRRGPRRGGQE